MSRIFLHNYIQFHIKVTPVLDGRNIETLHHINFYFYFTIMLSIITGTQSMKGAAGLSTPLLDMNFMWLGWSLSLVPRR